MVAKAYNKFIKEPLALLSSPSFPGVVSKLFQFFFVANMPCASETFDSLEEMMTRSRNSLLLMSEGQEWSNQLMEASLRFESAPFRHLENG